MTRLLYIVATIFLTSTLRAATWHVDGTASPSGDGSTNAPFATIQAGIDASTDGDTILVHPGIYTGAGNKNIDFGGRSVVLEGIAGPTSTVIDCSGVGRGFHIHGSETTNTVIRGFTIKGANTAIVSAIGVQTDPFYRAQFGSQGSAILCESNAGITIENCMILNNQAMTYRQVVTIGVTNNPFYSVQTVSDGYGGGIRCHSGTLVVRDSLISGNKAGLDGGGIYASGGSTVILERVTLRGNVASLSRTQTIVRIAEPTDPYYAVYRTASASGSGGGLAASSCAVVRISACTIDDNEAGRHGGGIFASKTSRFTAEQTLFLGNLADDTSARHNGGGAAIEKSSCLMDACEFRGNVAGALTNVAVITTPGSDTSPLLRSYDVRGAGRGGALSVVDATCRVIRSTFRNNRGHLAGGAASLERATVAFTNCLMVNNEIAASTGIVYWTEAGEILSSNNTPQGFATGLLLVNSDARLMNCTLWNNPGLPNRGNVDVLSNSSLSAVNSIIWSNGIYRDSSSTVKGSGSFVQGDLAGFFNSGANPVLTPSGRLRASSPCIDAGIALGSPSTDLDGEGRVDVASKPNVVSAIDVGADEFVDTDGDGLPDAWEPDDLTANTGTDTDGDRLSDIQEYELGSDPQDRDSDDDGMRDGWEVAFGHNLLLADSAGDPDLDGYNNRQEFLAATLPFDGTSYPLIRFAPGPGATNQPTIAWNSTTQRIYVIQGATVPNGTYTTITSVWGNSGVTSVPLPTDRTNLFLRMGVKCPPPCP